MSHSQERNSIKSLKRDLPNFHKKKKKKQKKQKSPSRRKEICKKKFQKYVPKILSLRKTLQFGSFLKNFQNISIFRDNCSPMLNDSRDSRRLKLCDRLQASADRVEKFHAGESCALCTHR